LCEFFTSLRLESDLSNEDSDSEDIDQENEGNTAPFIVSNNAEPMVDKTWKREALFDASRGDIGLAWSIFQVCGSPSKQNWPVSSFAESGRQR
jgi:hypothetical protein